MSVSDYKTWLLEDGEEVIRLRGAGRKTPRSGRRSDRPHAGWWGAERMYLLVPHSKPGSLTNKLVALEPGLENRSSDAEVLVIGPEPVIRRLLDAGPSRCRAIRRRQLSPEQREIATARLEQLNRERPR